MDLSGDRGQSLSIMALFMQNVHRVKCFAFPSTPKGLRGGKRFIELLSGAHTLRS